MLPWNVRVTNQKFDPDFFFSDTAFRVPTYFKWECENILIIKCFFEIDGDWLKPIRKWTRATLFNKTSITANYSENISYRNNSQITIKKLLLRPKKNIYSVSLQRPNNNFLSQSVYTTLQYIHLSFPVPNFRPLWHYLMYFIYLYFLAVISPK